MNTLPPSDSASKPARYAVLFLLTLILCAASASVISAFYSPPEQERTDGIPPPHVRPSPDVVSVRPGWWESTDSIYHDIPAGILFHLGAENAKKARNIAQKAWTEFERIGLIFNPFNPASELSVFNAENKSQKTRVSADLFKLMRISRRLWLASNGCFDPTTWQIKKMWQNAEKTQQLPSDRDILKQLQHTGFEKVHFSGKAADEIWADDPDIMFDFGGVVKGYAVDRVREMLIANGVTAGLVQLGGEISAFGKKDNAPWRIGIQHPKLINKVWGVVTSDGRVSVSTSGNYRQPMIIEGETLYHIFNPKTGKPVSEKVLGVTTASFDGKRSNALLDGAATAITVMGRKGGTDLAEELGIQVLILYEKKDGAIGELMTPGFAAHYKPDTHTDNHR